MIVRGKYCIVLCCVVLDCIVLYAKVTRRGTGVCASELRWHH